MYSGIQISAFFVNSPSPDLQATQTSLVVICTTTPEPWLLARKDEMSPFGMISAGKRLHLRVLFVVVLAPVVLCACWRSSAKPSLPLQCPLSRLGSSAASCL